MAPKRKAPHMKTEGEDAAPPTKMKKVREGPASTLTPVGPRERAVKGVKNEALLHMLCDDSKTGGQKELHFKKLVHAQIDWNSADDIGKINSWRNQLYGRAGMKAKLVCMWHEDEENWLELYFHLLIVEGMKHGLMIPRSKDVLEDFNNFFKGKVLFDSDGEALVERPARKHNAFVSKLNRMTNELKERLETVLRGKSGDYFRPQITEGMLAHYGVLKKELEEHGVNYEIYSWHLPPDGTNDSPVIEHWHKFFSSLPAVDDDYDAELDSDVTLVDSPVKIEETAMDGDTTLIEDTVINKVDDMDAEVVAEVKTEPSPEEKIAVVTRGIVAPAEKGATTLLALSREASTIGDDI